MNRAIHLGLMTLACAALLFTAVLLPAVFLRYPSDFQVDKEKFESGDGLSRGQRFAILEQRALQELGPEAALSSALAKHFTFPHSRDDAIFGIDVSHHNETNCGCRIDWNRVATQNVAFAYLKASEGISFRDRTFDRHWSALARQPNIHRGAYHFLRADVDVERQANIFLGMLEELQPDDMPPAVDLEWDTFPDSTRSRPPKDGNDYWSNLEPDEIIEKTLRMLELIEKKTNRVPVLYTSYVWWMDRIRDEKKIDRFKKYPIWLSAMQSKYLSVEKPGVISVEKLGVRLELKEYSWNWAIWQFTNSGDLTNAGIQNPKNPEAERMDVNIFPGTIEQFRTVFGIKREFKIAASSNSQFVSKNSSTPVITPPDSSANAQVNPTPVTKPDSQADTPPGNSASVQVTPAPETKPDTQTDTGSGSNVSAPINPTPETNAGAPASTGTGSNVSAPISPTAENNAGTQAGTGTGSGTRTGSSGRMKRRARMESNSGAAGDSGTGSGARTGSESSPPRPTDQRMIVEIVLMNGRIIRVDSNIDPAVLSRLITVLDGP